MATMQELQAQYQGFATQLGDLVWQREVLDARIAALKQAIAKLNNTAADLQATPATEATDGSDTAQPSSVPAVPA